MMDEHKDLQRNIKLKITLQLTADQWELYTDSMACGQAARLINFRVAKAINDNPHNPSKARTQAMVELKKFTEYGACDKEPLNVLDYIINRYYRGANQS